VQKLFRIDTRTKKQPISLFISTFSASSYPPIPPKPSVYIPVKKKRSLLRVFPFPFTLSCLFSLQLSVHSSFPACEQIPFFTSCRSSLHGFVQRSLIHHLFSLLPFPCTVRLVLSSSQIEQHYYASSFYPSSILTHIVVPLSFRIADASRLF
jgi:hypothetical protein